MNDLLTSVLEAHGGLHRWSTFNRITTTYRSGGELLRRKMQPTATTWIDLPTTRRRVLELNASTRDQATTLFPFGGPGHRCRYSPNRVSIETTANEEVSYRNNPRERFAGHDISTPWDPLDLAYFAGYTQWLYLNGPFAFTLPGVQTEEIEPRHEGNEIWRALRVTFPPSLPSHCTVQTFYYGPDLLQRRHDYEVEIAGNFMTAHYTDLYRNYDGLMVPTRRRAYLRDGFSRPLEDRLVIWIDYVDINFSFSAESTEPESSLRMLR